MEIVKWIVWLIYPYTVVAVVGMGIVWQYDSSRLHDEYPSIPSRILTGIASILLFLTSMTGVAIIAVGGKESELPKLLEWLLGFLHFNPDIGLISHMSVLLRVHLVLMFTFFLFLSFTGYLTIFFNPIRHIREAYKRIISY